MLAQFPSRDLDEPVTKEFVALQVAGVRTEIADLRTELHQELGALRTELRTELHAQTDQLLHRVQIYGALGVVGLAVVNAFVG